MLDPFWERIKQAYEQARDDPTYDITFDQDGRHVEVGHMYVANEVVILIRPARKDKD